MDYTVTNGEDNKAYTMDKSINYFESDKCDSDVIYQVYLTYGLVFDKADNRKWS